MPTFENPSHRRRLTELGILSPDESYVAPADLAHRMVASPYFEEVLYILKQDFAHPLTTFGMIESQLEMLAHEATQIQSISDLHQVAVALKSFFQLPEQMEILAIEMQVFGEELEFLMAGKMTITTQNHLADIERFWQQLRVLIARHKPLLAAGLADIQRILEQKAKDLTH